MNQDAEIAPQDVVTASLLVIGDEILSGRTKDKNIGHIADHLTAIGIQLREVRIVPDIEDEIVGAVNALRTKYNYLFTTGGIGPTHDDITADAVAKAFGVGIDVDERALTPMKAYFERRGVELTPARLRMARIPFGAELVENSISIAPGFKLGNVIVMAGVPNIMHVMLDAATKFLKTGKKMLSEAIDLHRPALEQLRAPLRLCLAALLLRPDRRPRRRARPLPPCHRASSRRPPASPSRRTSAPAPTRSSHRRSVRRGRPV